MAEPDLAGKIESRNVSDWTRANLPSGEALDQELKDWDAYVRMLPAGKLTQFAGEYIVIHQGNVIAHGSDLEKLRLSAAEQLGIAPGKVVIPFIEDSECIVAE